MEFSCEIAHECEKCLYKACFAEKDLVKFSLEILWKLLT